MPYENHLTLTVYPSVGMMNFNVYKRQQMEHVS